MQLHVRRLEGLVELVAGGGGAADPARGDAFPAGIAELAERVAAGVDPKSMPGAERGAPGQASIGAETMAVLTTVAKASGTIPTR